MSRDARSVLSAPHLLVGPRQGTTEIRQERDSGSRLRSGLDNKPCQKRECITGVSNMGETTHMNPSQRVITKVYDYLGAATLRVVVLAFLCANVCIAQRYPRVDLAVGYEVEAQWPQRRPEESAAVPGIAVDAKDQIWTFHRLDPPVRVYSRDGKLIRSWGKGQFKGSHQIKIDHEGNVWLADYALHVVRKFTPQGKLLLTLGTPGQSGADDKHLNAPTDMAITPLGEVFVADGYGNNRVVHFDAHGRFIKAWGRLGTRPGEFSLPHSIALDSSGRLYVADRNNARVQVFNQSGKFLAEWRNLLVPWSISITPKDEIYICGSSPMRWGEAPEFGVPPKDQLVMKFTAEGRLLELCTFPKGEDGSEQPGELNWVHGIAVDSSGDLYLGDIMGKRAQKFMRRETAQIRN